jgi:hypothetical protein
MKAEIASAIKKSKKIFVCGGSYFKIKKAAQRQLLKLF